MIKRSIDILFSFFGLLFLAPILIVFSFLIWFQDYKSPFYISKRVGVKGYLFSFIKLRSMVVDADSSGVDSTSSNDLRITPIGSTIRKYKIDEIPQLIHVLFGKMSLVGPRPNVTSDVDLYTEREKELLTIRPGITDFSSIVFSDEGDILQDSPDPDLMYNQLIRPWKSRLGLLYIKEKNILLDLQLIFLTICAIFNRSFALRAISRILTKLGANDKLIEVSKRDSELKAYPPPGTEEIVMQRS